MYAPAQVPQLARARAARSMPAGRKRRCINHIDWRPVPDGNHTFVLLLFEAAGGPPLDWLATVPEVWLVPLGSGEPAALVAAAAGSDADACLLGLGPDLEENAHLVGALAAAQPGLPLLAAVAQADLPAVHALLRAGAQDVIAGSELEPAPLVRAVGAAVWRVRYAENRATRGHEQEYAALSRYEDEREATSIAARMFGGLPLSRSDGAGFDDLARRYADAIVHSLRREAFIGAAAPDPTLRELAGVLGRLRAGPRDVVALHTRALRARLDRVADGIAAHAFMDEARYVLVQLMGHLLSYYRSQLHGAAPRDEPRAGRGEELP